MAFIDTKAAQTNGLTRFLADSFDRVKEAYDRRQTYLATRRELTMLTDRELADIGVARANIDDIARKAA